MQHESEIHRRSDGSIDMDHYIARGRSAHGQAVRMAAMSLWDLLGARLGPHRKTPDAAGHDLSGLAITE